METIESLSDVLRGSSALVPAEQPVAEAAPAETPPEKPAEAPAEKPTQPRDESGKFAKTEGQPEPEQAQEKPPVKREVAAIIDERRKRQALEARLREIEAKPQNPEPPTSVFQDEDKAISQRVDAGTRGMREQLFTTSMRLARIEHKDFGDAEAAFMDAAESDPRLWDSLRAAADPGEYVYSIGSHIKELGPYGGSLAKRDEAKFAALQGQIAERDQRLTALETELAALKKTQADLDAVPRSLNKVSSSAAPKATTEDAEPLNKIVRFGNH